MCQPYLVSLDSGVEGSGGTNQMAGDVIARMTLLMGGKSERASALCHHTSRQQFFVGEGGRASLASSSIRSDKGKCVKEGWVSEWRRERGSFDIPIGTFNLSSYENVILAADLLLANGDVPIPSRGLCANAVVRLGFSRLGSADPYLCRPYESAAVGGRGVC